MKSSVHIAARRVAGWALCALLIVSVRAHAQTDPLPSWNDGPAKKAIVEFVQTTTTNGSTKFVPPAERVATFDQDGTLWVEQPMYSQVVYCLDRVPALVEAKPELAKVEPFKTVMSGNREAIAKLPEADLFKILAATLTGMPVRARCTTRRLARPRPGTARASATITTPMSTETSITTTAAAGISSQPAVGRRHRETRRGRTALRRRAPLVKIVGAASPALTTVGEAAASAAVVLVGAGSAAVASAEADSAGASAAVASGVNASKAFNSTFETTR